jgi:hypothetical protein
MFGNIQINHGKEFFRESSASYVKYVVIYSKSYSEINSTIVILLGIGSCCISVVI